MYMYAAAETSVYQCAVANLSEVQQCELKKNTPGGHPAPLRAHRALSEECATSLPLYAWPPAASAPVLA